MLSSIADARNWAGQPENRRVLGAIASIGAFALAARAVGAAKDLTVAYRFGVSDGLDAFLVAAGVVLLIANAVTTSIGDSFLPRYVTALERDGADAAANLQRSAMLIGFGALAALAALVAWLAPDIVGLIAPTFPPEKRELARALLVAMTPALAVGGWSAIWTAVLFARGRTRDAAFASVLTPALTLVLVIAAGRSWGAYALALGVLGGSILEAAWLGLHAAQLRLPLRPRWTGASPALRLMMWQLAPLIWASFLATSTSIVDQAMAARLGPGSVSSLSYGSKVVALILGVGNLSLSYAVFPRFASLIAAGDWQGVRRLYRSYTLLAAIACAVGAAVLIAISDPLVRILFQRGAFSAEDATIVADLQRLLLLQLPFHLPALVAVRLLGALGRNQVLAAQAVLNLALSFIGDYVLMRIWNVHGIALANSLVYVLSFALLSAAASHALRRAER